MALNRLSPLSNGRKKGKIVNIVNNLYIYIPFRAFRTDGFFHFIIIIRKSNIYTS